MRAITKTIGVCLVCIGCALVLVGCGGGGGGGSPTPAPSPTPGGPHCTTTDSSTGLCKECVEGYAVTGANHTCLYSCSSNLDLNDIVKAPDKKGLMLDDTTFQYCADSMHNKWANTKVPVKSIRIPKAWQADWQGSKQEAWKSIASYMHATGAKALVGTSLTCSSDDDDKDWDDVKKLLEMLGPENVMGVAIGNELDLLWNFNVTQDCLKRFWGPQQYAITKFNQRVRDLDTLGSEWKSIKVTSPFSQYIFAQDPFVDIENKAKVLTWIKDSLENHGSRYAFSLNNYPYFDTGLRLDEDGGCEGALGTALSFDANGGFATINGVMRDRMSRVQGYSNNVLWITETGWSSPKADTLKWDPNAPEDAKYYMAKCPKFSSMASFQTFYQNFLKWVPDASAPDHTFFMGMRDSNNQGLTEHFGLGGSGDPTQLCVNTTCKIQKPSSNFRGFEGMVV